MGTRAEDVQEPELLPAAVGNMKGRSRYEEVMWGITV